MLPLSGNEPAGIADTHQLAMESEAKHRPVRDSQTDPHAAVFARAFEIIPQYAQAAIIITETEPLDSPGPQVIYTNPTCERMTGIPAEQAVGQSLEALVGPAISAEIMVFLRQVCADGTPFRAEFAAEQLDGSFLVFDLELVPVQEPALSQSCVILYLRDVTNYRRAEFERDTLIRRLQVTNRYLREELNTRRRIAAELQQSQALLQSFLDHVPVALGAQDPQGRFILANQHLLRTVNRHALTQVLGHSLDEIATPVIASLGQEQLQYILQTLQPTSGVYDDLTGEGTRWLTRSFPICTPDGAIIAVGHVAMDITEHRRHEEARLMFERRLQEAQRRESIGVLAGGLAHDFNNLLTAISGHAELLSLDLPSESPLHEHVEAILQGVQQASELTAQMLAYAGKGRFVMQIANLNDLIRDVTFLLESLLSRRASLHFRLAESLPPIMADVSQIRQVILNLLVNAADALGDASGQISLETASEELDRTRLDTLILGADLSPGRYVRVSVSDTGCGMDEATRARIFEPFFSTKAHGRGLGMAATHGIIRSHKGAIDVWSAPGQGTTIHVYFPEASP